MPEEVVPQEDAPELVWQRPSFSADDQDECLEVAIGEDGNVYLRESHRPDEVVVTTWAKWDAWVKGVKAGEFDHFVE